MSDAKPKVLIVDDERPILESMKRVLRRRYDCELANTGQEALDAVKSNGPFAIIMADMRMPGMSGIELLAEMLRIAPDTVRIMLTGNAEESTESDARELGQVFKFLHKPCQPSEIEETLDSAVAVYMSSRQ